ncbi:hypothetical protein AAG906_038446 [Vitis piasezkii]
MEGGLLTQLAPRPVPQPVPPRFRMDLHCSYHQGPGHDTDHCAALRHAIQDLIDQGLVNLGQPSVTTNPLPAHSTHAATTPGGIHHIDFVDMGSRTFTVHLISNWIPFELTPIAPPTTKTVAQPPPLVAKPFDGAVSHEEYTGISIWSLLASSSTHRDALIRSLSQIRGSTIHTLYILRLVVQPRVLSVLLDNGSALNVCPLATAIALGYAPSDFGTSTQTVRAYDSTKREVMGFPHPSTCFWADHGFTGPGLFHLPFIEAMSFDQHSDLVLNMMRGMYMARAPERVRARLTCTPFDYPVRPYRMSLMRLRCTAMMIAPSSPDRAIVPHDEYRDEMDMSMSQIVEVVQPEFASPFDLFGVSAIEVAEETQIVLAPELMEDVTVGDDEFEDTFGFIEGASDFVDPPLSFDILSGFISRSNDVYDFVSMDLSIFKYLPVSCDSIYISAPYSLTPRILDIDDEFMRLIHIETLPIMTRTG